MQRSQKKYNNYVGGSSEVNHSPRKIFKEDALSFMAAGNQLVPDEREEDSVMLTNSISRKQSKRQSGTLPTIKQYRDLRKDLISFNTSEEATQGELTTNTRKEFSKKQLLRLVTACKLKPESNMFGMFKL